MSSEKLIPVSSLEGEYDVGTRKCAIFQPLRKRFAKYWHSLQDFVTKAVEMGRADPRKIIYAIKMGFALSFVSLLIFWKKPQDISQFSIWAILTVIVMFEFSIGATFIKGFNRSLGTFCAGMLAFFFAALSLLAGEWEKVIIVLSFFLVGSIASYLKLYPTMAPYEYGYRVFVLTYCILMVAGNRTREYVVAIVTRLVLIAVGACLCFIMNIFIYPIWSGDDLHRLVVNNFKELATSLEGCVEGYLKYADYGRNPTRLANQEDDQLYRGYKTVIESASREQNLLGFAVWEPPHGRFKVRHYPWKTYSKVSSALRHCAYTVMALHGCILSEIQAPPEKRQVFRAELLRVSEEGAKFLRELGSKFDKMEKLGTEDSLKEVQKAAEKLQKKIDQRSFLLVNSSSQETRTQFKELEDLDNLPSEREHENLQLGFKSLSEPAIYIKSPRALTPRLPSRAFTNNKLRKHLPWPSWISFDGDELIKEDEINTYQSASALSLATFVSLLIEFVARLQNLVDSFEELSEEAGFSGPDGVPSDVTKHVGLWTRLSRSFTFKR